MYKTEIISPGYVSPKEYSEGKGSLKWATEAVERFLNEPLSKFDDIEPISVQYIEHRTHIQRELIAPEEMVTYTAVLLYKEI